jgi:hypothetical protein
VDNKKWYYAENKERKGPFGEEQVSELIDDHVIVRKTFVWTKGLEKWARAEDTDLLTQIEEAERLSAMPPPMPDQPAKGFAKIQIDPEKIEKIEKIAREQISQVKDKTQELLQGGQELLQEGRASLEKYALPCLRNKKNQRILVVSACIVIALYFVVGWSSRESGTRKPNTQTAPAAQTGQPKISSNAQQAPRVEAKTFPLPSAAWGPVVGDQSLKKINDSADKLINDWRHSYALMQSQPLVKADLLYGIIRMYQSVVDVAPQMNIPNDPQAIYARKRIAEIEKILGQK